MQRHITINEVGIFLSLIENITKKAGKITSS